MIAFVLVKQFFVYIYLMPSVDATAFSITPAVIGKVGAC